MSKRSTYKVAHAQKTLNMIRYLAITKTSLDGGNQDAEMPPKKEATLNGPGNREEVVDPQADVDQAERVVNTAQAKAIGQLMVNIQQLQGVVGE